LEEGSISNKTIKSVVYAYNTTLIPATAPQLGPGPISLVGASGGASKFSAVTVENNVEIANLSGGPGGASAISAAMADWIWGIYGTITLQNNYVDPTGAHYCVGDLGGSAGVTGSVSTNTLTVTSINQGAIYPNATFSATGLTPAKVAAYGTVDPATGSASTGAGGVGTYVLAGPAQNATFTGGVTSSPVAKLVEGGNISLVTGSPITGINGRAGSATCPPLF
jgi:hypothetical protein